MKESPYLVQGRVQGTASSNEAEPFKLHSSIDSIVPVRSRGAWEKTFSLVIATGVPWDENLLRKMTVFRRRGGPRGGATVDHGSNHFTSLTLE